MFSASGGSTWHLMGFIMTNCIAAGLHKTVPPRNTSDTEYICRVEWLFWSVYLWDRLSQIYLEVTSPTHSFPTATSASGESFPHKPEALLPRQILSSTTWTS
ncbi:hypothetical protein LB505_011614 [Fusarium chuoi]|nr:hypothetical protein LB505_011614 [Fusarium chuoi]